MIYLCRSIVGSLLLHLGSTIFLYQDGKVFGCSSILYKSVFGPYTIYTLPVIIGMILSTFATGTSFMPNYETTAYIPLWKYSIAGLLSGIGTKYASGCTSGHMLCGVPRLSIRSWIATICFVSTGILTVYLSGNVPDCKTCCQFGYESFQTKLMLFAILLADLAVFLFLKSIPSSKFNATLSSLFSGFTFGLGLILAGMAEPAKVLGFLALTKPTKFDPDLAFVIAFGMIPNYIAMVVNKWFSKPPKNPVMGTKNGYDLPISKQITPKLIFGSMTFGIGWGIGGICPGPSILTCIFNPRIGLAWLIPFLAAYRLSP